MPRTNRVAPGGFHALNRGVGRRKIFSTDRDYLAFEETAEETLRLYPDANSGVLLGGVLKSGRVPGPWLEPKLRCRADCHAERYDESQNLDEQLRLSREKRALAETASDPFAYADRFRGIQLAGGKEAEEDIRGLYEFGVQANAAILGGTFVRPSAATSVSPSRCPPVARGTENAAASQNLPGRTLSLAEAKALGAPNSAGRGLIGLVKPGGTVDDALRAHYVQIAKSPQMARAVERYNKIAKFLGQKPSANIDEIVKALGDDVTFSRVGHIRSGVFVPGRHGMVVRGSDRLYVPETNFWIQGNPTTAYGRRVARHELTHLGAALRGQGDTFLHEIAVQAATTPENLVFGVGSIVVIGGTVYWVAGE